MAIRRRQTRKIKLGPIHIGGDAPISVQSMTNTDTRDVEATLYQIRRLEEAGCEIVRLAVPDAEAAHALKEIRAGTKTPLIADIHFDHTLALASLKAGKQALIEGTQDKPIGAAGSPNQGIDVVEPQSIFEQMAPCKGSDMDFQRCFSMSD